MLTLKYRQRIETTRFDAVFSHDVGVQVDLCSLESF
mgnify:CR=1 FL=1